MVVASSFIEAIENHDAKLVNMEYSLFASKFSTETAPLNWANQLVSWLKIPYIFSPKGFLHFKIKDNRTDSYNCCYLRALFTFGNSKEEVAVPFCALEDLTNLNELNDSIVQGEDNWFFVDLRNYDIKCTFATSPLSTGVAKAEILNKHIHPQGNGSDSYYIRNNKVVMDTISTFKCIFSRGDKSSPRIRYD